ncbi:MAG TPA: hypothetical protein VH478_20725 [Trebonia sp.]|jgi:hypothetical protein|nr:hypothetical protein [Trebonia sp.]
MSETRPPARGLLGVYLNDHLAGAIAGVHLVRRMSAAAEPGSDAATILGKLATQITADRAALIAMMDALGIPVRGYKALAAWAAQRAGSLKPNLRLLSRSPLSDLEEAEALRLGVEGKADCWRTLRLLADHDDRLDAARLDHLLARAIRQSVMLEELRTTRARTVLPVPAR